MIFHRLRLINKNQLGFTLLELMLAMAISGIISGGITMSIFQVLNGSARTNNHLIAVNQVQNAGYWVSLDAQMAQIVVPDEYEDTGFPLTLTRTDWDTNEVYQVTYTLDPALKNLQRIYSHGITETSIIAQFIDPEQTSCVWDGEVLTFTIMVTVGGQSETRVYEIKPRPG
jgi:prepilin-type N-terminal cleavage/methylation domain-containing protein